MRRILHLIPTLGGGGAERQLAMLAAGQVRSGSEVHVGVRSGGVNETAMRAAGVRIHQLGNLRGPHPRLFHRIAGLMNDLQPQIVQTWLAQMDIVGGSVAVMKSVPWVCCERSHGLAFHEFPIGDRVRNAVVQHADAIVANSAAGAEYWRRRVRHPDRVHHIANAVDADAIRRATSGVSARTDAGPHVFLVVGRLAPEKSVDTIIEAVRQMPSDIDFRVDFVGEGPLREPMMEDIRRSGLESRIRLLPYAADWWKLLPQAAASVSMSTYEGHPNVVLESIAAGCPVILSDIPAHRELVNDQMSMFVPLRDGGSLARAMVSLVSAPVEARKRADRASAVVSNFTVEAASKAYDVVYGSILSAATS